MRTLIKITKSGTTFVLSQTPTTKHILDHVLRPFYLATRYGILVNAQLWGTEVWTAWEIQPLDKKLAWLLFLNHTIAIITLIELFALKRR